jgi:predicted lipoprotein
MKKLITISLLLLPIVAVAQDIPGMSEEMMLKMQNMQTCMEGVDQSALQAFEQRSNQMDSEVKALCASGRRDEAQQMAISFGQEVAKTPALQEIKRCGEMMEGAAMPNNTPLVKDTDYSSHHVCDN